MSQSWINLVLSELQKLKESGLSPLGNVSAVSTREYTLSG